MDIERVVEELRAERNRLDGIIIALERLQTTDEAPATLKRRGRKFMDKQGRKEVSERMKRYWAQRRTGRKEKQEHAEAAGASDEGAKANDETRVIAA